MIDLFFLVLFVMSGLSLIVDCLNEHFESSPGFISYTERFRVGPKFLSGSLHFHVIWEPAHI
jgi:hypothetical protein